ncbi:MAG: hypothetical protein KJO21_13450 [Verrucomicrobiae bacterium]|nr:hypothetical protein [Verrucomicrobiae bacterium]NNJ44325.1 hypothetical protein [Akkermansiaceae bacterium]
MKRWMLLIGLALAGPVGAEPGQAQARIGYIYPAGAQQGASLEVTAGGRSLGGVKEVIVSGEGVKASYVLSVKNFKKTYGDYLRQMQKEIRIREAKKTRKGRRAAQKKKPEGEKIVPPDHPLFRELEHCTQQELAALLKRYYKESKQKNREIDELCLIKVTVDADAEPGMREVRLRTNGGISNPVRFFVGGKPECLEVEPNDKVAINPPLTTPFLINGQITAGDIDRFQFHAKAGQQLLIQGHARSVIPYIADAVPGWFQATLAIYDATGKELAYADDYRFSPDPVLFYEIPADAIYQLAIRDSIYRGREDFVYRISVGEDPFVTHIFPLGGSHGRRTEVALSGWNLPSRHAELDTQKDPRTFHELTIAHSNPIPYAVDELPEIFEAANNDTNKGATAISLPVIMNGRIERSGDKDIYQFDARAGDRVIAEVMARRLQSPLDSMLRLTDAAGHVITWNDDAEQLNLGMLTHHADSKLSARLPREGRYLIHLSDAQGRGGRAYGYRLRVSKPIPDFAVSATPSSISVRQGCSVPIAVHAVRKDGFDGEINLVLKDAPKGFKLSGATIPAGCDFVRMTLTAPMDVKNELFEIRLQARAKLVNRLVTRDVTPGEAMTQAFITHHIMPVEQIMVYVGGRGVAPELILSKSGRVSILRGGETTLRLKKTRLTGNLQLKLYQAPEGISLELKRSGNNALSVSLKADEEMKSGVAGNLMIEVFREQQTKNKKVRLMSMGVMPAVPFTVK